MQEHEIYTLLIGLWACSAIIGMIWVGQKGYCSGMAWNAGCMFVLVGWWAIPLLLFSGVGFSGESSRHIRDLGH